MVRPAGVEPARARLDGELSIRLGAGAYPWAVLPRHLHLERVVTSLLVDTGVASPQGFEPWSPPGGGRGLGQLADGDIHFETGAPGAGLEPAVGRLTGACVADFRHPETNHSRSLSTDSNGPLPDTGRVRRHLRLRGSARRSPHQATADLQTCDPRSASAEFFPPPTKARASRRSVASRLIRPEPSGMTNRPSAVGDRVPRLQGSESNRRGPAYEAGSGANPPCRKTEHAAGIEPALPARKQRRCLSSDRPRRARFASAQRESNPLLRTGAKPACSLEHLGRERKRASRPGTRFTTAHPELAHSEETERVRTLGAFALAGVKGRCAEPTGTSSPREN